MVLYSYVSQMVHYSTVQICIARMVLCEHVSQMVHYGTFITLTIVQGKSVACSTPAALAWDESFTNNADPSGRAVAGVHVLAYGAK